MRNRASILYTNLYGNVSEKRYKLADVSTQQSHCISESPMDASKSRNSPITLRAPLLPAISFPQDFQLNKQPRHTYERRPSRSLSVAVGSSPPTRDSRQLWGADTRVKAKCQTAPRPVGDGERRLRAGEKGEAACVTRHYGPAVRPPPVLSRARAREPRGRAPTAFLLDHAARFPCIRSSCYGQPSPPMRARLAGRRISFHRRPTVLYARTSAARLGERA